MKLLLYCTKSKKQLLAKVWKYQYEIMTFKEIVEQDALNGKIVAECEFEVEEIKHYIHHEPEVDIGVGILPAEDMDAYCTKSLDYFQLNEMSCSIVDYILNNKNGYAIYIKNLNIFDKPKELNKCMSIKTFENEFVSKTLSPEMISKAPQNMMKVKMWVDGKEYGMWKNYVLISIRPEWLCKILNGEKTIELRKKVLKEMIS